MWGLPYSGVVRAPLGMIICHKMEPTLIGRVKQTMTRFVGEACTAAWQAKSLAETLQLVQVGTERCVGGPEGTGHDRSLKPAAHQES